MQNILDGPLPRQAEISPTPERVSPARQLPRYAHL